MHKVISYSGTIYQLIFHFLEQINAILSFLIYSQSNKAYFLLSETLFLI